MTEQMHTPGPWKVAGDGYDTATYVMGRDVLVRGGSEDRVIAVCHSYRSGDRISRLHNAALIAAAPDLLEALKRLLELGIMNPAGSRAVEDAIEASRAAIAKVEVQS